jgi:hypothetical protein
MGIVVQIHLGNKRGKILLETVAEDLKIQAEEALFGLRSERGRKTLVKIALGARGWETSCPPFD